MTPAKPKLKKCKECSREFVPRSTTAKVCGMDCAILHSAKVSAKNAERVANASRTATSKAIKAAKTRGEVMKEAQAAFNAWVRARDEAAGLPCISCGSHDRNSWDAGHYRARSVAPALRFHQDNVHRQCVQCNRHQHGNLIDFRIGLVKRIGLERVEWLEGQHGPVKHTIPELEEIKMKYRRMVREIRKKPQ